MLIMVKLIGIIIIGMGIVFLLSPKKTLRQFMVFFQQGRRLYGIGVFRLLMGVILLLAARQCRLVGVVITLGILFLMGGIMIFILGLGRIKPMLNRWQEGSLLVLRLIGIIALAIGSLLLYSI